MTTMAHTGEAACALPSHGHDRELRDDSTPLRWRSTHASTALPRPRPARRRSGVRQPAVDPRGGRRCVAARPGRGNDPGVLMPRACCGGRRALDRARRHLWRSASASPPPRSRCLDRVLLTSAPVRSARAPRAPARGPARPPACPAPRRRRRTISTGSRQLQLREHGAYTRCSPLNLSGRGEPSGSTARC